VDQSSTQLSILSQAISGLENQLAEQASRITDLTNDVNRSKRSTKVKKVQPTFEMVLSGWVYLSTPATVDNTGGSTSINWSTYDASSSVPFDAEEVLLDIDGSVNSGSATGYIKFKVRRASGDPEIRVASAYGANDIVYGSVGVKVVRSYEKRTFDFDIQTSGSNTWTVRILGYRKLSRAMGTGWTDVSNPDGSSISGGSSSGGTSIPPL